VGALRGERPARGAREQTARRWNPRRLEEDADGRGAERRRGLGHGVASESSGDAKHRVFGAALFNAKGGTLPRVAQLGTFRYPVSSIAMSEDDAFVAVAANTGELVSFRLDPKAAPP